MKASEAFVSKYAARDVPHAAEAIAALRAGSARVTHVPAEVHSARASELLRTYEVRAKHLSQFSTAHATQLRQDVEAFCASLRLRQVARCIAWGIESDPHFLYWFWEAASDGSFLGATKTVDGRKISEAERLAFWGPEKKG